MMDIRKARKAARLTQAQVAKSAHISRPRLCYAENGEIELRAEELCRIREIIEAAPRQHAARVREVLDIEMPVEDELSKTKVISNSRQP